MHSNLDDPKKRRRSGIVCLLDKRKQAVLGILRGLLRVKRMVFTVTSTVIKKTEPPCFPRQPVYLVKILGFPTPDAWGCQMALLISPAPPDNNQLACVTSLSGQVPLLHRHYSGFIATTDLSAPVPRIDTIGLAGSPLVPFS